MEKIAFLDFDDKYVYFFLKNLKEMNFNVFLFGKNEKIGKEYSSLTKTIFLKDLNYLEDFEIIFLSYLDTYYELKKMDFFDKIKNKIFLINPIFNKKKKYFEDLNKIIVYDYVKDTIYYRKEDKNLLNILNNTHFFIKKVVFSLESYDQLLDQVFKNYLISLICNKFFNLNFSKREFLGSLNEREKKLLKDLVKDFGIWSKKFLTKKTENKRWNYGDKGKGKNIRSNKQSNK